jgi:hypothetical protein
MNTLLRELRYAARRLRQAPGFTLTALLSLALGIGANTAAFSLVNAILLRRPPLAQAERLVEIHLSSDDFPFTPFSYPDYEDFQRVSGQVFSGIAASKLRDGLTPSSGSGPGTTLETSAASRLRCISRFS